MFSDSLKFALSHAPSADIYNLNTGGKVVSLKNYEWVAFLLIQATGGGNTGTAAITVEACNNFTPTTTVAIPFRWRKTNFTGDTMGAYTNAAATGFPTVANETALYIIEIRADELPQGFPCVRLKINETVNDPVNGTVITMLGHGRYQGLSMPSAIA